MTGVDLPATHRSASSALIEVIRAGARRVPALGQAAAALSREALGETVLRFEAARVALPMRERVEAARAIVEASARLMQCIGSDGEARPLPDALHACISSGGSAGSRQQSHRAGRTGGMVPRVPWGDAIREGPAIEAVVDEMVARNSISPSAAEALRWVAGRPLLDLTGERFVVMGAAAELAPTELLLEAGAEVLHLDIASPQRWLARGKPSAGTLVWPQAASDLLADPVAVLSTILAFADCRPVHLGLFGYAGGANREWRLAAAMNAIARAMPTHLVKSIGMYVSPTSPAQALGRDAAIALARARRPSLGERCWQAGGVLRHNMLEADGRCWVRSVVAMQGTSYLAAQYVEKRLSAEVFALPWAGRAEGLERAPIVSAQVAGVTRTASMDIPAFKAALVGAAVLGVHSYTPTTTRWLSGLVYLENLLNPASGARPAGDGSSHDADRVHSMQVHGGLYAYPWAIDGALKRAAVIGLWRQPRLIPAMFVRPGRNARRHPAVD